jgi:hypothetical protein
MTTLVGRTQSNQPIIQAHRTYSNQGGFYFEFEFENKENRDNDQLKIGFSFCHESDNFEKEIGKKLAKKMIKENPIIISYDRDQTLIQNAINALKQNHLLIATKAREIQDNQNLIGWIQDEVINGDLIND